MSDLGEAAVERLSKSYNAISDSYAYSKNAGIFVQSREFESDGASLSKEDL